MLPSSRLILLVLGASPVFLAGSLYPPLLPAAFFYLLFAAVYAVCSAVTLPSRKDVRINRVVPERISVGVPTRIFVDIENLSRRTLRISLAENITEEMHISPGTLSATLCARERTTLEYRLTVNRRGKFDLQMFHVRLLPAAGALYRQYSLKQPAELKVYPNLMNLERHKLLTRKGLSHEEGISRVRDLGAGSEFESLRNYVVGDDYGKIEWKASARRNSLIVKKYEPERRQSVVVLLDVGRATSGEFNELSLVDYLVNAALMMAYVTLRQKDWFSLVAFSDRIEAYLPPIQGVANIDKVAQALYDVQPRLVESDYDLVCHFISQRHRKRSLFCMMTDILDSKASSVMISHMSRIRRYHLPLLVTLANSEIDFLYNMPLQDCESPYAKAVAIDVKLSRKEALVMMRHRGISVLDVSPDRLTTELINRYVQIKTRHLL